MSGNALLQHDRYMVRRKMFTLFGAAFHVYDDSGGLLLYTRQKAFRFKEDLRLYTDQTQSVEVMRIKARQVIDFGATYDVIDTSAQASVGSLRRRGLKSMLRDEWVFFDADGGESPGCWKTAPAWRCCGVLSTSRRSSFRRGITSRCTVAPSATTSNCSTRWC